MKTRIALLLLLVWPFLTKAQTNALQNLDINLSTVKISVRRAFPEALRSESGPADGLYGH